VLYVQSVLSEHKPVRHVVDQLFDAACEKGQGASSIRSRPISPGTYGRGQELELRQSRVLRNAPQQLTARRERWIQRSDRPFNRLGRRHQPERAHCGCGGAWTSLHGVPDAETRRTDYSGDHQPSRQMHRHDEVQRPSLVRLQTPITNLLSCSETCCGKVSNDHERQA
jgi:hypothetical protein